MSRRISEQELGRLPRAKDRDALVAGSAQGRHALRRLTEAEALTDQDITAFTAGRQDQITAGVEWPRMVAITSSSMIVGPTGEARDMIERDALIARLRRQFNGGALRRLPRNPEDADLLMALSLLGLDADAAYEESDINLHLITWLNGIVADDGPDYVTLRRRLVDGGFLRRSSDGVVYRVQLDRVDALLSPEAKSVDVRQVLLAVQTERSQRRQAFRS